MIAILLFAVAAVSVPQANAELESRREIRAGDVHYNSDTTIIAILRALYHQSTLAETDTGAFAMSPLPEAAGDGLAIAQTSADTVVATDTGFAATLRFAWVPYEIGDKIGDSPEWATNVAPISFAGIPRGSMMIFPQMTVINRMPGNAGDFHTVIDVNASLPLYPGNRMQAITTLDDQGQNTMALERPSRGYWSPYIPAQEVANKTIMQRMWANSHIVYKLDGAYVGETCFPDRIWPVKGTSILIPMVPDDVSIKGAMNMTHAGMHMRKIFWPVG